jgi:hypothetical protein
VELIGTVSDFGSDGLFGVIVADDGRVLLFNLFATPPKFRERIRIGARVRFELGSSRTGRAIAPVPIDGVADSVRRHMQSPFGHRARRQ